LIALEEDDKDRLVDRITRDRIGQRLRYLGLAEEDIASACSPQESFKCGDSLSLDDAGNEPELLLFHWSTVVHGIGDVWE